MIGGFLVLGICKSCILYKITVSTNPSAVRCRSRVSMENDGTGALLSASLSLLLSQVRSSLFYLSTLCHASQFFSCRPERRVRASDLLLLLNLLLNLPHCPCLLLDKQCVRHWRQAVCEVRRPCRPFLPLCGCPTDVVAEQHLLDWRPAVQWQRQLWLTG